MSLNGSESGGGHFPRVGQRLAAIGLGVPCGPRERCTKYAIFVLQAVLKPANKKMLKGDRQIGKDIVYIGSATLYGETDSVNGGVTMTE